tara:strand:- start:1354 stop:1551 length:198 start_codon:yes stop_codon:yes gene_type:complete
MANCCNYCDTRKPTPTKDYPYGTKIMFIGDDWFEFCEDCGSNPEYSLTNSETNETATLAEVFEML